MNKESKFGLLSDDFKGYIVRLAFFALFRCLLVIGLAAWFLRSDVILNGSLPGVMFPIEIIFTGAAIYMFIEALIFTNMYQDAKPVSDKNNDEMTIGSFIREVSKAVSNDKTR